MAALTREQRRTLVALLSRLPNLGDAAARRLLLADLPPALVQGIPASNAAAVDLATLVNTMNAEPWLTLPDGTRPVVIVVENAADMVPGSGLAGDLHAFLATLQPPQPAPPAPAGPPAPVITYRERRELYALLPATITTLDQLRALCFALGIPYRTLEGKDLAARLESLAWAAEQRGRFAELGAALRDEAERQAQARAAQDAAERAAREQARREAEAYTERGNAASDTKRYEEALADYTHALQLEPNYAVAYYERGNTNRNLTRYEEALADYTRALQLDPNFAFAYNNRGITYYALQRYEEALADYTRALQLDPNSALAYGNRAITYRKVGRTKEAQADDARASRLETKSQ